MDVSPAGVSPSDPVTEGVSLLPESIQTSTEVDSPSLLLDSLIKLSTEFQPTTKENVVMSEPKAPDMKDFAVAFMARCKESTDGEVTSYELVSLREKFGIESTTATLTRNGWILRQIKEGCQKAGAYKPGPAMESAASAVDAPSPVDPSMPWVPLLAKEAAVIAKIAELQEVQDKAKAEQDAAKAEFARIAEAKSLVEKLKALAQA